MVDPVPVTLTVEPIIEPEPVPALAPVPGTVGAANPDAPYPPAVRSVRFLRNTVLHKEPATKSAPVGIIKKDDKGADDGIQQIPGDPAVRRVDFLILAAILAALLFAGGAP